MYAINRKINNLPISYEGGRLFSSHFIVLFVSLFSFSCDGRALPSLVSPYFDSYYRVMTRNSTRFSSEELHTTNKSEIY